MSDQTVSVGKIAHQDSPLIAAVRISHLRHFYMIFFLYQSTSRK